MRKNFDTHKFGTTNFLFLHFLFFKRSNRVLVLQWFIFLNSISTMKWIWSLGLVVQSTNSSSSSSFYYRYFMFVIYLWFSRFLMGQIFQVQPSHDFRLIFLFGTWDFFDLRAMMPDPYAWEAFLSVPTDCEFCSEDEEVVYYYLHPKVTGAWLEWGERTSHYLEWGSGGFIFLYHCISCTIIAENLE